MPVVPRLRFSSRLTIPLFLVACLATGCQTTVGNYFANRGRDFSECFLLQIGSGLGLGADVKAAGLLHADVGGSIYVPLLSVGTVYGHLRPTFEEGYPCDHVPVESDWGVPSGLWEGPFLHGSRATRAGTDGSVAEISHTCWGILPGLLSWHEPYYQKTWIWAPEPRDVEWLQEGERPREAEKMRAVHRRGIRWSRVHAFDIEVGAFALIVGARAGFSPGEFIDFLLGWFGVDIAGDDHRLERVERPAEGTTPFEERL